MEVFLEACAAEELAERRAERMVWMLEEGERGRMEG